MNVAFHEDIMYVSSEIELAGEYQKKIQTFDYDFLDINLDSMSDDSQARPNSNNKKRWIGFEWYNFGPKW